MVRFIFVVLLRKAMQTAGRERPGQQALSGFG
jgi:hypothetical protein